MKENASRSILLKSFESLSKIVFTAKGVMNNRSFSNKPIILFKKQLLSKPTLKQEINNKIHSRNHYASHAPRSTLSLLNQHTIHAISVFSLSKLRKEKPHHKPLNLLINDVAASFLNKQMYHRNSDYNLIFPSKNSKSNEFQASRRIAKPINENTKKLKKLDILMPSSRDYRCSQRTQMY